MIKQDDYFLTSVTERMGKKVGELYTTWHDMYSIELSYKWLEENNYPIEAVLEQKHQNNLSFYLIEHFIKWYKAALKEG